MSSVSVVIPCQGRVDLLELAIRSCLRQEFVSDIVVVADQVAIHSAADVVDYAKSRSDLLFCLKEDWPGVGAAANQGAAMTKGDYLCFLNPQDELLRDYFSRTIPLLDSRREFSAIRVGIQLLDQFGDSLVYPGDPRYDFLMSLTAGNLVIRRSSFDLLGGFPENPIFSNLPAGIEGPFSRAVDEFVSPVGFIPEAFYRRNVRPGSSVLEFLANSSVTGGQTFMLHAVGPENAANAPLAQAIDAYLKAVGERVARRD